MTHICLQSIGLGIGSYPVLANLSFDVPRGQFVALVGPTGCGKSSVLNLVAGLLKPSAGLVYSNGSPLDSLNRDAAYMLQHDALLPWKTVFENIMLGPLLRGASKPEASSDAKAWIERVGLRATQHHLAEFCLDHTGIDDRWCDQRGEALLRDRDRALVYD